MKDYTIDEYKMLRTEILHMLRMTKVCEGFATATLFSSFSLIFIKQYDIVLIFLVIFLYIINIKRDEYYYGIANISAYMHVFLEPKLKGINWETNCIYFNKMENNDSEVKVCWLTKLNRHANTHIISYSIIATSLTSIYNMLNISFENSSIIINKGLNFNHITFTIMILFVYLASITIIKRDKNIYPRKKCIEKWKKLKEKLTQ